jgi:hypothetical protein
MGVFGDIGYFIRHPIKSLSAGFSKEEPTIRQVSPSNISGNDYVELAIQQAEHTKAQNVQAYDTIDKLKKQDKITTQVDVYRDIAEANEKVKEQREKGQVDLAELGNYINAGLQVRFKENEYCGISKKLHWTNSEGKAYFELIVEDKFKKEQRYAKQSPQLLFHHFDTVPLTIKDGFLVINYKSNGEFVPDLPEFLDSNGVDYETAEKLVYEARQMQQEAETQAQKHKAIAEKERESKEKVTMDFQTALSLYETQKLMSEDLKRIFVDMHQSTITAMKELTATQVYAENQSTALTVYTEAFNNAIRKVVELESGQPTESTLNLIKKIKELDQAKEPKASDEELIRKVDDLQQQVQSQQRQPQQQQQMQQQ